MLIDELNECKGNLNKENARLVELETQLKVSEKHTDKIRYPILTGVIGSFIVNTFGHIIMNPFVVLGSLLILAAMIPAYVIFMTRDSKSGKIEEQIKVCKDNIKKYEDELELLNYRSEVTSIINQNDKNYAYSETRYPSNSSRYNLKNNNSR